MACDLGGDLEWIINCKRVFSKVGMANGDIYIINGSSLLFKRRSSKIIYYVKEIY